jgi:hypothetical protein
MRDVVKRRPQVGQHSSASAYRLLDLDGFQLVAAEVVDGEEAELHGMQEMLT